LEAVEVLIKPLSSWLTDFQSDTLFGHLAWMYRYMKGESRLEELLDQMSAGGILLVSSAFPEGFLPRPVLPVTSVEEKGQIISELKSTLTQLSGERNSKLHQQIAMAETKKLRKLKYLPETVIQASVNQLSELNVTKQLCKYLFEQNQEIDKKITSHTNLKVSIDRRNMTAREGLLYSQKEFWTSGRLRIFFKSNLIDVETFKEIMENVGKFGFGKKASSGKGCFTISEVKPLNLPEASEPNGFLTLSNYIPNPGDYRSSWYSIFTKYPKVGIEMAFSNKGCFCKKAMIMYEPGSLFLTDKIQTGYGGLIKGVYPPASDVVKQYSFAFPLKVRVINDDKKLLT
jgi:CRISPR-associated protein Csm4